MIRPLPFRALILCLVGAWVQQASGEAVPATKEYEEGLAAENRIEIFQAKNHFLKALANDPDIPGASEHVAWFLFLNGFHDRDCLRLMQGAAPKGQFPDAMQRATRQVERELGLAGPATDAEKAEAKAFNESQIAIARNSGSDSKLGGALVDAKQYEEGLPLLHKAHEANPQDLPLALRLARGYFWGGKVQEADAAYAELLTKQPENPALLFERAQVSASQGNLERGVQMLASAEKLAPAEPKILLERSRMEALLFHRSEALEAVDRLPKSEQESTQAHLARARADHYNGQMGPAAENYELVLADAPFSEEAAHGLSECRMRGGDIAGAYELLDSWDDREKALDWDPRTNLYDELTDPRMKAQFASYSNSLNYLELDWGLEGSFKPDPAVTIRPSLVNSLFQQTGFSNIDRQGGFIALDARPDDVVGFNGRVGLNGYTSQWLSPNGGGALTFYPVHWMDIGVGGEFFDLIDFEPPFGVGIYDLVTSIGGVGNKISSTQGTLLARVRPYAGWTVYGRTRLASFSDGNTFRDNLAELSYDVPIQDVRIRAGYSYYYMSVFQPASLYRPVSGGPTSGAYYDPSALNVNAFNLEVSGRPFEGVEVGGEGHLYSTMDNGGFGQSGFAWVKLNLGGEDDILRLDGRYFTQNRGFTRNNTAGGSFDAINILLSYEHRF
jgi:tetratricopeptide (TPR) repeat protein